MANVLRVNIHPGVSLLQLLVVDPVELAQADGSFAVGGMARLELPGATSDAIYFSAADGLLKILRQDGEVLLHGMPRTAFAFPDGRLEAGTSGPVMVFSALRVRMATSGLPLVSAHNVFLTLASALGLPSAPDQLRYPPLPGDAPADQDILAATHPQDPSERGMFLLPFEDGLGFRLGSLRNAVAVRPIRETWFELTSRGEITFKVAMDGAHELVLASPAGVRGVALKVDRAAKLAMSSLTPDAAWASVKLDVDDMRHSHGWARVERFKRSTVVLGRVENAADTLNTATLLCTRTDQLAWEANLAGALADVGAAATARFTYRSAAASLATENERQGRFIGIRVKGLGSTQGTRPVLDTDLLAIDLINGTGAGNFAFKAGGSVPVGGTSALSVLTPKISSIGAVLDIPYDELVLRCTHEPGQTSPLLLDTSQAAAFVVTAPVVRTRPMGFSAVGESRTRFTPWELVSDRSRAFRLGNAGLEPADGAAWLTGFSTRDPGQQYHCVEHPGAQIRMDGASSQVAAAIAGAAPKKTGLSLNNPNGLETVVYSALFVGVGWFAKRCVEQGLEACLDTSDFSASFPSLDDAAFKAYVKSNGISGLQIVFATRRGGTPTAAAAEFRKFIDENMLKGGIQPPPLFQLGFAMGLSAVLYQRGNVNGVAGGRYAYELNELDATPPYLLADDQAIAFDFNASSALTPSDLGWSTSWQALAQRDPLVWPRATGAERAKLDPSQPNWRGIFLRGLSLRLPIPALVAKEFPWLQNIVDAVNNRLNLDYGWLDETGASWVSRFRPTAPIEIPPLFASWSKVFRAYVTGAEFQGSSGASVRSQIGIRIVLPQIITKDTGLPLEFTGNFGFDVSGDGKQGFIDIGANGSFLTTESIPGFESVRIRRLATDFKSMMQLDLEMVASKDLSEVAPVLSSDQRQPLRGKLVFGLAGDAPTQFTITLPSEQKSRLFDKWPYTIRAIALDLSAPQLSVNGRINFGIPGIETVGATLVVGPGPNVNLALDEFGGELSVGSFRIKALARWRNGATGSFDPIALAGAATAGADREIWGVLEISDPGVIGDLQLVLRIGSINGSVFWVASLGTDSTIGLGSARLRKPALMLAHNADFGGNMAKLISSPTSSVLELLRPEAGAVNKWLGQWQPSTSIGTTVAGSGFLETHPLLAQAPSEDSEDLTSLIFNDTGIVRIDSVAALLGAYRVRFSIMLNYPERYLAVGLQIPKINIPDTPGTEPQYVISPGRMVLEIGFGGTARLTLSLGWPEKLPGNDLARDWEKSTMVHIKGMTPINTFQGGVLFRMDGDGCTLGVAFRAGWTWALEVGGGVVKGSADVGIMFGGLLMLRFRTSNVLTFQPVPLLLAAEARFASAHWKLDDRDAALFGQALADLDASLAFLDVKDVELLGEVFGDIWGKLHVEFMGVTLVGIDASAYLRFQVCGSLKSGLTRARAKAAFKIRVKILCVTYEDEAEVEYVLRDDGCPLDLQPFSLGLAALPAAALA